MNPQQIEQLGSGTPPHHPVIYLDGDFTVDELRQIVAACDAVMGRQVEVTKECRTWHHNGQSVIRTRIRPPIILDDENN